MTERCLKRPRDPARLAKLIVDIATGEVEDKPLPASMNRKPKPKALAKKPVKRAH
jgi:hypothetical protein